MVSVTSFKNVNEVNLINMDDNDSLNESVFQATITATSTLNLQ